MVGILFVLCYPSFLLFPYLIVELFAAIPNFSYTQIRESASILFGSCIGKSELNTHCCQQGFLNVKIQVKMSKRTYELSYHFMSGLGVVCFWWVSWILNLSQNVNP